MVSIRGPRSALTDFIREHGIITTKEVLSKKEENNSENEPKLRKIKNKIKKPRKNMPFELTNSEQLNQDVTEEESEYYKLCEFVENFNSWEIIKNKFVLVSDDELSNFSTFLSKKRKMNLLYFEFIIQNSNKKLSIFDCSMIEDRMFYILLNDKISKYNEIELHFCGQLTKKTANDLLSKAKNLENLSITEAFLIDDICIPKTVKRLNLSGCSRLEDKFISFLNKNFERLEELKLSKCYNLTDKAVLKIQIEDLDISETKLSYEFLKNLNMCSFRKFNMNMCPFLYSDKTSDRHPDFLKSMINLNHLEIEGISTIKSLSGFKHLEYLNVENCYNFEISSLESTFQVLDLNISNINIKHSDIYFILKKFKNLKSINVSWNSIITDEVLIDMIDSLPQLNNIYVFGCFNLTERIAEYSWDRKEKILIIGNPAETRYLLQ